MNKKFEQRKSSILSKLDKSTKGSWDKKIIPLCEKINKKENYYTTSSCAGRIVLMLDKENERGNLFVRVWHEKIDFEELIASLRSVINGSQSALPNCSQGKSVKRIKNSLAEKSVDKNPSNTNNKCEAFKENVKFKMESCILHVACENLESAQELLDKAREIGWKRSGIITSKDRIILELNSTEKLEFPVIRKGKVLVDENFLKIIVEEANKKLEKAWDNINELSKKL